MPYPNISSNQRTIGEPQFYWDPLHKQVVGLTTIEFYRSTEAQIQTEIDTANENITKQNTAKATAQAVLDGL